MKSKALVVQSLRSWQKTGPMVASFPGAPWPGARCAGSKTIRPWALKLQF